MAFIDFTNGEVLTADQMDTVMRQSVMKFADAAARDTALSAVLAEGMMCYLEDTDEVLKYDGSQWIDISGDITGVTAGTALTGGGTSGNVTLDVDETALTIAQSQVTDLTTDLAGKQDDVITTEGDLVIGDASGDPVRLPVGSADQVLTSDGTTVSFQDAGGGGTELYAAGTHTVSKPSGVYLVDSTQTSTANGSIELSDGINDLPALTSLEISNPGESWTFQNSEFVSDSIENAAFGDGIYMIVGDDGAVATSTDGISWTRKTLPDPPFDNFIYSVVYGDGLWVVGGISGTMASSSDTDTWTVRSPGVSGRIYGLAYGGGTYVAVTNRGAIGSSTNAVNWSLRRSSGASEQWFDVNYGDGLFVAVGLNGDMFTSTDGEVWTSRTSSFGSTNIRGVTYGDGVWVASGDSGKVATSTDGISWTQRTTGRGERFDTVGFSQGVFVAAGENGTIIKSTDGISWTLVDSELGDILGINDGGTLFIAGDVTGQLKISSTNTGYLSLQELPTAIQP